MLRKNAAIHRQCLGGSVLENVILSIGKDEFEDVLFDAFHREMRARQVVLHHFRDDVTVETLAAKDDREDGCVHSLVRDYVHRYHVYDPFRSRCTPAKSRSVELQGFAVKEIAETEYSQRLFVEPGIAGKLCVIPRRPGDAICLSLYRDRGRGSFGSDDFNRIEAIKAPLAAPFERHLDLKPTPALPSLTRVVEILQGSENAPMLSSREAAVCARIVTGYSNEAIALDLSLSFHSVRTYRRRAYAKLNVSSQNELFALILNGGRRDRRSAH
jgi:DNA-binding CsgD family transcriptional regulator